MHVLPHSGRTWFALAAERNARWRICVGLLGSLLVGCSRNDDVTRYTVPRSSHEEAFAALEANESYAGSVAPTRMLAAIVPKGKQTWFFKLQGPIADVAAHEAAFDELIRSVRFSAGSDQPVWETPLGWRQQPESGMRFATLLIGPSDDALELTVIPLATGTGNLSDYVLANINRWRGQLGLPEISAADLDAESPAIAQAELADGSIATVVKLTGQTAAGPSMAMPTGLPLDHPPLTNGPSRNSEITADR